MKNLFDIKGRVVVMTGACGVLGATIVKYFASQGSKVVLLDLERARETGEKIVAEIKAAGGEAMFLPTNVLDEATVEQNCKDIVAAYGSVDILLNGAGGNMGPANVAPDQTIFDMDLDATRKVFELNIIGAIIPMDAAWAMADITMVGMTLINLPSCMILGKVAIDTLKDYEAQKKSGKDPEFLGRNIGLNEEELEFWK